MESWRDHHRHHRPSDLYCFYRAGIKGSERVYGAQAARPMAAGRMAAGRYVAQAARPMAAGRFQPISGLEAAAERPAAAKGSRMEAAAEGSRIYPTSYHQNVQRKPSQATMLFQLDSIEMAAQRYFPTSQSWAPGQWAARAFLIAVLLIFLFGLGLLILGYMLIVKPDGTLTATYRAADSY